MDLKAIQRTLAKSSYDEIATILAGFSDEELLALVDVRSRRIGGAAAEILESRQKYEAIIDAILDSRIQTAQGKIRATNILLRRGIYLPRAEEAYLALLSDRSVGVVDNALFGLVFSQKKSHIPEIERALGKSKSSSKKRESIELAIEALARKCPSLFDPYFRDGNHVWPPHKNQRQG